MNENEPSDAKVDAREKGRELFRQQILPQIEAGNDGRIVAIDVHTGDYELADDVLTASKTLLARRPKARIWCERIGEPTVYQIGWHPWRNQ